MLYSIYLKYLSHVRPLLGAVCLLAVVCVRWSGSIAADMKQSAIEEIKRLHLAKGRLSLESLVFDKFIHTVTINLNTAPPWFP